MNKAKKALHIINKAAKATDDVALLRYRMELQQLKKVMSSDELRQYINTLTKRVGEEYRKDFEL